MVYAGIMASTIIVTLGAFVVSKSLGSMTYAVAAFDSVVFVVGLGVLIAGLRQRRRLDGQRRAGANEQWWVENAARTLVLWGLLELGALIGAGLLFATGHLPVYAVLAGVALAGLALSSPGRLAGE